MYILTVSLSAENVEVFAKESYLELVEFVYKYYTSGANNIIDESDYHNLAKFLLSEKTKCEVNYVKQQIGIAYFQLIKY